MCSEQGRILLSYSHSDAPFVQELQSALDVEGIKYWADQAIRPEERWVDQIELAINEASVFVLIISPNFLASRWAMFEIGLCLSRAREGRALVIPVIAAPPASLPPSMRQFQYIDGIGLEPREVASKIRKAVKQAERDGCLVVGLAPDMRETIARAIHENYRSNQEGRKPPDDPSMAEWDSLRENLRESNRQQADHIFGMLQRIGCSVREVGGRDVERREFSAEEVEAMAEMEHERWNEERLRDGWTLGPRDVDKK